jgi:hypothetical protein
MTGLEFPFQIWTLSPMGALLFVFAVFRITRIVWLEDGPFDLTLKLRTWIMASEKETAFQRGIVCPFCISFWVAILLFFAPWNLVYLIGLMGGAAVIFEWGYQAN